jgi:putative ABC transport system permease protein
MTVSVIERTSEIGTMRALGAEKSFVRKLFFTEALLMTIGSALIGTVIAAIAAVIFNAFNITITNSIAKIILGGGQLRFIITPGIIIATIIITAIGGFLSNLYPVSSALKITPLKALSKGAD